MASASADCSRFWSFSFESLYGVISSDGLVGSQIVISFDMHIHDRYDYTPSYFSRIRI
jgi:hypothetical protein